MRVAFHFDAGGFGGSYGHPITAALFRGLLHCIPTERRDVFIRRGDFPIWGFAGTVNDLPELSHRIFTSSREIWSTISEEALLTALRNVRVWVLAVEGLTPSDATSVDSHLRENGAYLGAIEIHLANPTHWVLYDRKLIAAYRVHSDELRVLEINEHLDPEARHEGRIQVWVDTGLFARVEWEDIGLRDTVFDDLSDFDRARRVAEIEDRLGTQFGPLVGILLMRIEGLNPILSDSLHAALQALERAETLEHLAQASFSCRRFTSQLADTVYPARRKPVRGRKVGPQEYRNRLWAYIEENAGDERHRIQRTLQELGKRLDLFDERAQKHIHGLHFERSDVHRLILTMIVWTYDMLILKPPPKKASIAPHRDALLRFVRKLITGRKKNVH